MAPPGNCNLLLNLNGSESFDLGRYGGRFDLRLTVLNVFDRTYQLRDGSGIGVGAPQYGPRRTYVAGLSKTF